MVSKYLHSMIPKYVLELFESVKEYEITKLIESINNKIFTAIKSKSFNPKIAKYFEKTNTTGEPFTNFDQEPDNITQIKKLINALYHARLASEDIDNINLNDPDQYTENLTTLYQHTTHQAYMACHLITHLDVDLRGLFKEELAVIYPLITKFQTFAETYSEQTKELTKNIKSYPFSYNTGWVSGMAIDKMQASNGDIDYSFLTQFSSVLPGYIEQFTDYVKEYSSEFIEKESKLNKEKLEQLQKTALSLLTHLDNLKGNDFFVSIKYLNYIHIIRHVITLSMSSLEQMNNLSDSSQDVIRHNIAELKYKVLPSLFGLVDKIEVNAMLNPGTLSTPLMNKIKPLYEILIHYASKPVDFHEKGEELLSIEDPRFLSLRLELTYKRMDEANKALIKNQRALEALNDFYHILENNPECTNRSIHELPNAVKEALITHYKIIKPYMTQVKMEFNDILIDSLSSGEKWSSFLGRPWRWITGQLPEDHISFVIEKKEALRALITKNYNTHQFHKDLNNDMINSVHEKADSTLFPYSLHDDIYKIDESLALDSNQDPIKPLQFVKDKDGNNILTNPEHLNSDQALDLYQWYKNKHNKFLNAREAYLDFIKLLNHYNAASTSDNILRFNNLNNDQKAQLTSLYNRFQPYFVGIIPKELRASANSFDKSFVHGLKSKVSGDNKDPDNKSGTFKATMDLAPLDFFIKLDAKIQTLLTDIDQKWNEKSITYLNISKQKNASEVKESKLEHDANISKRAHYLIQHTNYSKMVNEFRKALYQMTDMLNDSMKKELRTNASGLPFPALKDNNSTLEQSKQTLALKRIFNSVYHIEEICHQLENLDNTSYESTYIYHVYQIYGHIHEIIKLTKKLSVDPFFKQISREIFDKAQLMFATIQEHSHAYQADPNKVPFGEPVQYNALWYVLNAFHISPKHIRIFSDNDYLTTQELEELQLQAKKASLNIESIINSSSSYFKLFLQTPTMYNLYRDLKSKLYEFTGTTHDAVMANLGHIRSQIITPMLLEADQAEIKLGLKIGTISTTLKNITDEYLKGLIYPLNLHSKTHLSIICDNAPIEKRIHVIYKKWDKTAHHLEKLAIQYAPIVQLYEEFKRYKNLKSDFLPAAEDIINTSKNTIIETYKKALPKLVALQKVIQPEPSSNPEDFQFDEVLNDSTKDYHAKLTQIKALVVSSHSYYLGLRASHTMTLEATKEKLSYLTQLKEEQEKANILYVDEYTQESFNRQVESYCNRHIGLQYTDTEYRNKLKNFLLTFKDNIVDTAKKAEDINLTIKNLLQDNIRFFEKNNFAKYYQLDTIKSALTQFKNYLSQTRIHLEENAALADNLGILTAKNKLIIEQDEIASNEQIPIEQRIEKIRSNVSTDYFRSKILAQKNVDSFSWNYIKKWFLYLLEALYLYTPEKKKLLNKITEAVEKEPQISDLTNRFGLFSSHHHDDDDTEELISSSVALPA